MKKMLFGISGPSGVGKTTLYKRLLNTFPNELGFSISATTRPQREGEQDGEAYYFYSEEDFQTLINEGAFLEWAYVHGQYYGTLHSEIDSILGQEKVPLLDVDIQGGVAIRASGWESKLIFILPPSMSELRRRLESRKSDSDLEKAIRIQNAMTEVSYAEDYDFVIVNADLEEAFLDLKNYVEPYLQKLL